MKNLKIISKTIIVIHLCVLTFLSTCEKDDNPTNGNQQLAAPTLNDPGGIDTDGNYSVSWTVMAEATEYLLQEDDNSSFSSPVSIYNGSLTSNSLENKPDGSYYYRVNCCNNSDTSSWSNPVDITVQLPQPILSVSPITLDFGTSQTNKTFDITNTGNGSLTWNITDNRSWITVNLSNGSTTTETDQIAVTINRNGLSCGSYSGTITVSSNYGNKYVAVEMEVSNNPELIVSPTILDYGITQTSKIFLITNNKPECGLLTWNISDNKDWISVNSTSGNTTTETDQITVLIDRSGLTEGIYSGIVTVLSNGGSDTVDVSMQIPPDPCDITVSTPNIGSNWRKGEMKEIYWTYENSGPWAKIELYKAGVLVCSINESDDNDGSASWIVTDCGQGSGSNYQIKVTDKDNEECYSFSEYFTINTCDITITTPNSGSRWRVGDGKEIYWDYNDVSTWAKIELYKGSQLVGVISEMDDNDGSAYWIVSDFSHGADTDYRIKVQDLDDPGCNNFSEYFEIRF